ncbi:uncharacterized protein [Porites lutea]|uniref:uncharacterized protein n=1 Tax=Porites lutea TaxID=51062 RepID=UPI003CC53CDB
MTDCNKEYKIIVLAWNERGHSDFDEDSVLTVFTDKGKPRTPLLKDIVPEKCGVVNVSWDPPPDESKSRPVASYEAEVGLDNYTWNNCMTTSEKRSCQFRGLLKAGKYPVRVRALNTQGPSLWSKGFIALNASDRPEIPEIINTETSTPGCNVTLKWAKPPSGGCPILFYTVHYSKVEPEGRFRKWTTINMTIPEVNQLELSLNCTTSYEFKVKAWNALGSSETDPNAWPIETGGKPEAGSSSSSGLPQDDNRNIFIIVACVVSFAALVVTVVTYIRNRKGKKKSRRRVKRTVNDVKVLEICEVPPIRTSFIEELGEGAFGKVHKALHQDALEFFKCQHDSSRKKRKQFVAVKELHDNATDERRREFLGEIELMKKVGKHQNVLSFLGCWTMTKPLLLITEYVAHGDLRQWLIRKRSQICANMETSGDRATSTAIERTSYVFYDMAGAKDDHEMIVLHQNRAFSTSSEEDKQSDLEEEEVHVPYEILSESEEEGDVTDNEKDDECDEDCESFYPSDLMSFAWQIARGMDFLSQKGLVHRDLAARNVLVGHGKLLKIADFGLMRQVYRDIYEIKNQKKLPIKWMAPESIFEQVFTVKSDIWSFGIVLWEVATIGMY